MRFKSTYPFAFLFVMALFLGITQPPPIPAVAQSDTAIPYVQYFSTFHSAFVIEQANGDDSRLFGAGLMPQNTRVIEGPGWSPSGAWFAWTAAPDDKFIIYNQTPYVLNVDGQTRLTALHDLTDADLLWSPNQDILAVIGINAATLAADSANTNAVLRLVDANTDTIIFESQMPTMVHVFEDYTLNPDSPINVYAMDRTALRWSADGRGVLFVVPTGEPNFDPNMRHPAMVAVSLDDLANPRTTQVEGLIPADRFSNAGYDLAPSDDNTQLLLTNFWTGETIPFVLEGETLGASTPQWNQRGTQAAIAGGFGVYLLDALRGEMIEVTDSNDAVLLRFGYGELTNGNAWSADDAYLLVVELFDDGADYYVYDLAADDLNFIDDYAPEGEGIPLGRARWAGNVLVIEDPTASPDSVIAFTTFDPTTGLDLTHFEIQNPTTNWGFYQEWLPYVAPTGESAVLIKEAMVVSNGDNTHILSPDSRSYFSTPDGEVIWHPAGFWFLTYEDALVAGGGDLRWTGVANANGTVRRELGYCANPTRLCNSWLPPQVDIARLPASDLVNVQPVQLFRGNHWGWTVAWSPGGDTIVYGQTPHGETTMTAFDLRSGGILDQFTLGNGEVLTPVEWRPERDGTFTLIESETWRVLNEKYGFGTLGLSPNGQYLIYGDYPVRAMHAETRSELATLADFSFYPPASFTPDSRLVVVADPWTGVRIYDTTTWTEIPLRRPLYGAAAFSPDGSQLAVSQGWNLAIYTLSDLIQP